MRAALHLFLPGLALLATARPAFPEDALSEKRLLGLKAATAYVLVKTVIIGDPRGSFDGISGSGFVVKKEGRTGWVVTNHHVANPGGRAVVSIRLVFNSGAGDELIVPATEVAADPAHDLALLRFEADTVPEPLPMAGGVKVRETQSVFVLGFPFGDLLASSRRSPAVTVSKASVSSLRRDHLGRVTVIQMDGAFNPGNSGGPVVAQDGSVVGVSVAALSGAQIGFVVPGQEVAELLLGRLGRFGVQQQAAKKGEAKLDFIVEFIDPFHNVASGAVLLVPADRVKDLPQADPRTNEFPQVSAGALEFTLTVKEGEGKASASLSGPKKGGAVEYLVQVRMDSTGSPPRYSSALRIKVGFDGLASTSVSNPPAAAEGTASGPASGKVPGAPLSPAPVDPGVAVVALPEDGEDSSVPLPKLAEGVAVAGNGRWLIIAMHGFNGLAVYDADQKKITHSIRLPTSDFLYAAGGGTVLVYARDARTLTSFEVATGKRVKSDRFPGPGVPVRMVMGRARGDRALLRVAEGTDPGAQCHYLMIDTGALSVVPWKPVGDGGQNMGSGGPNSSCPPESVHLRSDGMLGLVAEWCQSSMLVLYRIQGDGSEVKYDAMIQDIGNFCSLIAGDDGRLYTESGMVFDGDLATKKEVPGQHLIPGIGGIFYLGLSTRGTFTVFPCGQTTPLVGFGAFPDLDRRENTRAAERLGTLNGFDKQVVFDPVHGRLILFPLSLDKVVQRSFNVKEVLDASGVDYLVVITRPPFTARRGKTFHYRVQALSSSGGIRYSLESGPEGMTVSADGQVSWTPQAEAARKESVLILMKDKGDEQCFHTFDLFVVDAADE